MRHNGVQNISSPTWGDRTRHAGRERTWHCPDCTRPAPDGCTSPATTRTLSRVECAACCAARRDDVVIHADDAVASAKKILSSQTHRNGELGLPSQVTYLVMSQLHGVLEEMRDVSRSLEKVEETRADVEAAGMPAESLRSLDEAAQRLLADKVIEPGRKLAELAALTLSRDTMRMLGQLSADDGLGAGAPTSFEDLEARIHAASELTPL